MFRLEKNIQFLSQFKTISLLMHIFFDLDKQLIKLFREFIIFSHFDSLFDFCGRLLHIFTLDYTKSFITY